MTPPAARDLPAGVDHRRVRRWRGGVEETVDDRIAAEVPVALDYNGTTLAVMMASPADIKDFALGFSLSEGIVDDAGELEIDSIDDRLEGITVAMSIPPRREARLAARRRNLEGRSGCGICGSESIEAVLRPPRTVSDGRPVRRPALHRALIDLQARQPLNALTGATHAAAWATADGTIALVREDLGRHNAIDKLIGALARAGITAAEGFAVITSRASYEMVMKAAQADIPLLAAISAPTSLAIALAQSAGLTLVGFARDDGHAVYSHPQRIVDAEGETGTRRRQA